MSNYYFTSSIIDNINDNIEENKDFGTNEGTLFEEDYKIKYFENEGIYQEKYKYFLSSIFNEFSQVYTNEFITNLKNDSNLIDKYITVEHIEDFPIVKQFKKLVHPGWNIIYGIPYGMLDASVIYVCRKNKNLSREVMTLNNSFIVSDKRINSTGKYYIYKKENDKHYKYNAYEWILHDWTNESDSSKYIAELDYTRLIPKIKINDLICNSIQYNFSERFFIATFDEFIVTISRDKLINNNGKISDTVYTGDDNDYKIIYHTKGYYESLAYSEKESDRYYSRDTIIESAYLTNNNVFEHRNFWDFEQNYIVLVLKGKFNKTENEDVDKRYIEISKSLKSSFGDISLKKFTSSNDMVTKMYTDNDQYYIFPNYNQNINIDYEYVNLLFFENQYDNMYNFADNYGLEMRYKKKDEIYSISRLLRTGKNNELSLKLFVKDNLYGFMNVFDGFYDDIYHYNTYWIPNIANENEGFSIISNNRMYMIMLNNSTGLIFYKFNMYDKIEGSDLLESGDIQIKNVTEDNISNTRTNIKNFTTNKNTSTPILFTKNIDIISSNNNNLLLKKYDDKIVLYVNIFQTKFIDYIYNNYPIYRKNLTNRLLNYCDNSFYDKDLDDITDKACYCLNREKILKKYFSGNTYAITDNLLKAQCISEKCQNYRFLSVYNKSGLEFINSKMAPCDNVKVCDFVIKNMNNIKFENNKISACFNRSEEDISSCENVDCEEGKVCRNGNCVQLCSKVYFCDDKPNQNKICLNNICTYRQKPLPTPQNPDEDDDQQSDEDDDQQSDEDSQKTDTSSYLTIFGMKIKKYLFISILIFLVLLLIILIICIIKYF